MEQDLGLDTSGTYAGFSAQNIQAAIPEAVGQDQKGFLSLSDRPVMATMVNAIKELKADNDNLRLELRAANDNHLKDRADLDRLARELNELKAGKGFRRGVR